MQPHPRAMLTAVSLMLIAAAPTIAADKMTFKNNMLPGHLSIHKILRITNRISPRADYTEKLSYAQSANWVQCNLTEPKPGQVITFQMMVDGPAKVVSLFQGARNVSPLPDAARFNLSKESTRLHSVTRRTRELPYQVPLCAPAERVVLRAMLDIAQWPSKRIEADHEWERDILDGGFKGTQKFRFVRLARIDNEVVAMVEMTVKGEFAPPLDRDYEFEQGRAIIYWARLDQVLKQMESKVRYVRRRPNGDERYELDLTVALDRVLSLDAKKQDLMLDQLDVFANALKDERSGHASDARVLCKEFRQKWPNSIWLPAIEELADRVQTKRQRSKRLKTSQVRQLLGESLLTWEAARTKYEYDIMDRTRMKLQELCDDYHSKIIRMAESSKDKTRAQAVFALAFSKRARDFEIVQQATRDKSAKIRAMAMAGIAAKGDPNVSPEILMLLMEDKEASVRARTCQAVAACITREHLSVAKLIERLNDVMLDDEVAAVRLEAIRAIAAIGAPADVAKLQKAMTHELDQQNREEIKRAIERLLTLHD